ncbi:MAG: TonB-dependent receptor plug domain-containing protein, partial [Hyphomonadaceae bacterium]
MKNPKRKRILWLCLGALPAMVITANAHAQNAGRRAVEQSDEVVVTAERRATSVREVGFSIQAIAGETLRTQEIHGVQELTELVAGVHLNTSDKSIGHASIRGSTSTFRTATIDAPIGFFVDDVYYPYSTDLNANFFDLGHVEILRGPQGSLFGRNVTGGAIVLNTNDPTFDEDYFISLSGGNAGYVRTEGMINGPLIPDVLAGRLAFSTERTNGLIDTPNLQGNWGGGSSAAGRGKLLWTPSERLRVLFSADYSDYSGDGASTQLTPATRSGAAPVLP